MKSGRSWVKVCASVCVIAVLLGITLLQMSPAHAYVVKGSYQPGVRNIHFCIQPVTSKDSNGFYAGAGAWSASNTPVVFSPGICTVVMEDANLGNNGYVAESWESYAGTTCNSWAANSQSWVQYNTYYTNQSVYDAGAVQEIAAHELGHVLGLNHSGVTTLMSSSDANYFTYHINTPQADDENGINYIYSFCG